MTDLYAPKPGSLPDRVLAFLEANPEEELTRKDIAVKFGLEASASIDTLLQLAVVRDCLVRTRNSDGELVWSLGAIKAHRQAVAATATGTDGKDPLPVRQIVTSLRPQPVVVDPTAIKVRKGVKLQTAAEKQAEAFAKLFDSFAVGDSAEFEAAWEPMLRAQLKRWGKGKAARFVFAETEPGKVGMERRK